MWWRIGRSGRLSSASRIKTVRRRWRSLDPALRSPPAVVLLCFRFVTVVDGWFDAVTFHSFLPDFLYRRYTDWTDQQAVVDSMRGTVHRCGQFWHHLSDRPGRWDEGHLTRGIVINCEYLQISGVRNNLLTFHCLSFRITCTLREFQAYCQPAYACRFNSAQWIKVPNSMCPLSEVLNKTLTPNRRYGLLLNCKYQAYPKRKSYSVLMANASRNSNLLVRNDEHIASSATYSELYLFLISSENIGRCVVFACA